jgi:hypothetical protein
MNGKVVISPEGKLTVSGEIEAESVSVKKSGETIGTSAIKQGTKNVTVETTKVTANSKIFVTATSDNKGQALFISERKDGESFVVAVSSEAEIDITFDWWLVEAK